MIDLLKIYSIYSINNIGNDNEVKSAIYAHLNIIIISRADMCHHKKIINDISTWYQNETMLSFKNNFNNFIDTKIIEIKDIITFLTLYIYYLKII